MRIETVVPSAIKVSFYFIMWIETVIHSAIKVSYNFTDFLPYSEYS